jgi:hypothetical protein
MTDTGVVDPIRVPEWLHDGTRRAWDRTPRVARLFIGLAIVDVVSRWFGILQPPQGDFPDLRGLYAFFIPRDLWILLPAILLLRRPDASQATPLVYLGAAVVAVMQLVSGPIRNLLGYSDVSSILFLSSALALVAGSGWLLLARGVRRLNPAEPTPTTAGFSNLVLGFSLLGTAVAAVASLLQIATNDLGVSTGGFDLLSTAASTVEQVVWAYLLWIVIRGMGDTRRPGIALTTAAAGAAVTGILTGFSTVLGEVVLATQPSLAFWTGSGLQDLYNSLGFIAIAVGEALIVVAFALGLAEPPIPYAAPTGAQPQPAPEPAQPGALPT